jgi:hypothetical protein
MSQLVFFLEERSARAMLESFLPTIFPNLAVRYVVFQGKQQLEKELPKRLRGWNVPGDRFIVLRDNDGGDCRALKRRLADSCASAGRPQTVVRIACQELEAWYLGDLHAIEQAFSIDGLEALRRKAKFRDPDRIGKPSDELSKMTRGRYQKIIGSRAIGRCLGRGRNRSASFRAFVAAIERLSFES